MGINKKFTDTYRRYKPIYWVVITLELIERGAYYGIMGYFPVHLLYNLKFSGTEYGIIYGILVGMLYLVPLVSASLARKFGYKKVLLFAFILIIPTYISMTFLTTPFSFLPAVIAWGIGAGAFKPMVSATIAHVTKKEHRNSAYSIYYLSINYGSLFALLATAFLFPQHFAHLVFLFGAVLITINLLITIFLYQNPIETDPDERIFTAFKNMATVLSDSKFALLLLIYAGFFFVFSSIHTFIPAYYIGFVGKPISWFEAPLMGAINPFAIVLFGPLLARFSDRFKSLKIMIIGIIIVCTGLFVLGMVPLWYAMILGIFIFSIGEFLTHPNFISYVSKIAPEEKVAMYMGYAFLPTAMGSISGAVIGGVIWDWVAVGLEKPSLFWAIFLSMGILTIGNFLIYNKYIMKKKGLEVPRYGFFYSKWTVFGTWAVVPIIILVGFSLNNVDYIGLMEDTDTTPDFDIRSYKEVDGVTHTFNGQVSENEAFLEEYTLNKPEDGSLINSISFRLTWTDEDDIRRIVRTFENEGDELGISVLLPLNDETGQVLISAESELTRNTHGSSGEVTLQVNIGHVDLESLNGTGVWEISVICGDCGDLKAPTPALTMYEDTGNAFSMTVEVVYLKPIE